MRKMPTPTYQEIEMTQILGPIRLEVPQVTADNSHWPQARQLTLFYRLLPYLCRIRVKA